MNIPFIVLLSVLGALLGSFAVAQVWRLRARQLVEDKKNGEPVDAKELRRLKVLLRPVATDRSACLTCRHTLAWYDLVPVVSWLSLKGRCRYCNAPIGITEVLAEVGLGAVFALSYIFWPHTLGSIGELVPFTIWLVACVVATILVVYDAKWSLLPFELNIGLIVLGALFATTWYTIAGVSLDLPSLIGGIAILGGLYLVFSLLGWVGMGDGILGIGLALFLGSWQLAFVTLFLANLLGCLMLIPLFIRQKLHRQVRIPFGPFLIVAAFVSMLAGNWLISTIFSMSNDAFTTLML